MHTQRYLLNRILFYKIKRYINYFLFLILLLDSITCFAFTENEKQWLGINSNQTLTEHWNTFILAQIRLIDKSHPWEVGLLEGGIGYHFVKNQSFWLGYRWSGHNPNNGFHQENSLFLQLIKEISLTPSDLIILRTRLEEREHSHSSQINVRLRQRLGLQIDKELIVHLRPFLYDELFFQVHPTQFTSHKFVSENRIFLGFNLFTSDTAWWEIGYINQFRMKTPQESQNTMSHVVSIIYNF